MLQQVVTVDRSVERPIADRQAAATRHQHAVVQEPVRDDRPAGAMRFGCQRLARMQASREQRGLDPACETCFEVADPAGV